MDKILTTHVGYLPRKKDLLKFIFARDNEEGYDEKSALKLMSSFTPELPTTSKYSEVELDSLFCFFTIKLTSNILIKGLDL